MGDYAGFVARLKEGAVASDVERDLIENGARNTRSENGLGLIIGILKDSYPGGCKLTLMACDSLESFAVLSRQGNTEDDYASFITDEMKDSL